MQSLKISNVAPQSIGATNSQTIVIEIIDVPHYQGSYSATPSATQQTFQTAEKYMEHDFVVNPIPNNYGLITYNGFSLTVS